MTVRFGYPYVTAALRRIHNGVMPRGGFPSSDPDTDPTWYEQVVYAQDETLVKPSAEAILAEVAKIKQERGELPPDD